MSIFKKTKRSIGLEISDSIIRVVELSISEAEWRISGANEIRLEPGIVEEGVICDAKALARSLRGAFSGALPQSIKSRVVHFALPDEIMRLRLFRSELSINKGIKQAVESEYKRMGLNEAEGVSVFRVIESEQSRGFSQISSVVLAAAAKDRILSWQKFFESMGLRAEYFDIGPLALYRGFFEERQEHDLGFLRMDEKKAQLSLFSHSGLSVLSTWPIGLRLIASDFDGSYDPAQAFLEDRGIRPGEKSEELSALAIAIKKALDSASGHSSDRDKEGNHNRNLAIKEIVICGDGGNIPGLCDFLSALVPGIRFASHKTRGFADASGGVYAMALGLALRNEDGAWDKSDPILPYIGSTKNFEQKIRQSESAVGSVFSFLKKAILLPILVLAIAFGIWMISGAISTSFKQDNMEGEAVVPTVAEENATSATQIDASKTDSVETVADSSKETEKKLEAETGTEAEKAATTKEEEKKKETFLKVDSDIGQPLNVRKGPGRNFEIVGEAPEGSEQVMLEEKGDWYRIEWGEEQNAWVNKDYVTVME
jgi:hypothetical protein